MKSVLYSLGTSKFAYQLKKSSDSGEWSGHQLP